MSIGYKKIFQLIEDEVSSISDLDDHQKRKVESLCKDIYMKEASTDSSRSVLLKELKNEISHVAAGYNDRVFEE